MWPYACEIFHDDHYRVVGVVSESRLGESPQYLFFPRGRELGWNKRTYLAGVDLLAAEGVVVGTHLDGGRCADGRLALRCWSEIEIHGSAITGPNCGAPR